MLTGQPVQKHPGCGEMQYISWHRVFFTSVWQMYRVEKYLLGFREINEFWGSMLLVGLVISGGVGAC